MKFVKTDRWYRIRGQLGPNNEIAKLDTPVVDKPRVFFVPETDAELDFFDLDIVLRISGAPYGPTSNSPDAEEWGWRFYPDRTEEDMKKFAAGVVLYMEVVYEKEAIIAAEKAENDKTKKVLN